MLRPTEFRLKNLRTFHGDRVLNLHPWLTVIVGTNNSGKSSLLLGIYNIASLANGRGAMDLARHGSTADAALAFEISAAELEQNAPDIWSSARAAMREVVSIRNAPFFLEERGIAEKRLTWRLSTQLMFSERGVTGFAMDGNRKAPLTNPGAPEQWLNLASLTSPFAKNGIAMWSHTKRDSWHQQQVSSPDTDQVRHGLTFLRMNHDAHYEQLAQAITTHLEEVERIHFAPNGDGTYQPHIKLRSKSIGMTIAREAFGGGAWTFISVLTAAHVAHATGARMLLLDEPTLFMHPQLERALLRELRPKGVFADEHLQLVIAAHSPILVDAAYKVGGLRIIDWADRTNAEAKIVDVPAPHEVMRGDEVAELPLNLSAGEFVYAERLLFVEGASDVACLSVLSELVPNPCRPIALHQSSWFAAEGQPEPGERYATLARIAKLRLGGALVQPRALLDEDARAAASAQLDKLKEHERPLVRYVGDAGQDFEALFCEADFLEAFFNAEAKSVGRDMAGDARAEIEGMIAKLGNDFKGDQVVYGLFASLLGERQRKTSQFARVARYLVDNYGAAFCSSVRNNLQPVIELLDASKKLTS